MGFQFTFDVAVLSIFGDLDSPIKEKLRKNYCILDKGYNSFPLSLPGTSYNTSVLVSMIDSAFFFLSKYKERGCVFNLRCFFFFFWAGLCLIF